MMKKMPEYSEPYNVISQIPEFYMEISKEEAGVICGLIKEYRPRKIMEIGVAAGGSTCLILKCLELLGMSDTLMYSLDLNESFYRNGEKDTGYIAKENKEMFSNYCNHSFLLGKQTVDRVEELEEEIDFLFLDTVHAIPGEILDFLLLLPRLSKNAIVVLHDTNLHNISPNRANERSISNRVLVNTVTATKFYTNKLEYLNIGAFQIEVDTYKYIADVFASLILPWTYYVDDVTIKKYREYYEKNYSKECIEIFDNAVEAKEVHYGNMRDIGKAVVDKAFTFGKKVFVYGAGYRGKKLLTYLKGNAQTISGIIVSDEINIEQFTDLIQEGEKIYHFSEIPVEARDCIILLAIDSQEIREFLDNSAYKYVEPDRWFFDLI